MMLCGCHTVVHRQYMGSHCKQIYCSARIRYPALPLSLYGTLLHTLTRS
jgi:hypothetical protein